MRLIMICVMFDGRERESVDEFELGKLESTHRAD